MSPQPAPQKKTDRRTRYTKSAVKDALLELLEEQSYEKITVAALCRKAEITRATFYIHYQDLDEVLNELLDEALMVAEAAANEMRIADRMGALEQLASTGSAEALRQNEKLLSPCQRVADDPKYRAVFRDPTLADYVIQRIYKMEREEMTNYLTSHCNLDKNEADKLFMMIVYGLFYMNRSLKWSKDKDWYEMQYIIERFMFGGFKSLQEEK